MPGLVTPFAAAARLAVLAAGLIAFVAAGGGERGLGPSTLNAPGLPLIPEVTSVHGLATLALRAALDGDRRPAFFWHGREVAPTIRVHPGDEIRLHYENALPQFCGLGMISASNLHFHGLQTTPAPPGDEVITTNVAPGTSYDYTIKVDRRQPPGLYWYHPHPHGIANWEIGNGMAGALVIEGIADELPQLAGLRERVIVLRDIPRDPSVAAAERPQRRLASTASRTVASDEDQQGSTPCGVESDAQPTVNGVANASFGIRPGERQVWRILNAAGSRHFDLTIPGMRVQLIALDGVPLGYYGGAAPARSVDHLVIPPGGRAEIVVQGPEHPHLLLSRCYDTGKTGDVNPGALLGEIVDDRNTTPSTRIAAPSGVVEDAAYRSLPPPVRTRRIHFDEDARGFYIDHVAYNPARGPAITARSGTVEEWRLDNDTDEVHAFHLHQVHVVVEATNGVRDRTPA